MVGLRVKRSAIGAPAIERVEARVRRELVTVLMRLGDLDAARITRRLIPTGLKHLNSVDQASHILTLQEMQAEIDDDCEGMKRVSERMAEELGKTHPYTIRTGCKYALLLPKGSDEAIRQTLKNHSESQEDYGKMYAGTINAAMALIRCLVNRGERKDLEKAWKTMEEDVLQTGAADRFGKNAPESLEIGFQYIIIRARLQKFDKIERYAAIEKVQKILKAVSETHGRKHPTFFRVTFGYIMLIDDRKSALKQMQALQREAKDCLRKDNRELLRINEVLKGTNIFSKSL